MSSLNPLANHVSGLSAHAVEALAHRLHAAFSLRRVWKIASKPSKFFISNPSAFSGRGRYPDFSYAATMNDGENPLRLQLNDIRVWNQFSPNRVNHFNRLITQNKFWSNPNQVSNCAETNTNSHFKSSLHSAINHKDAVYSEENKKKERGTGPNVVTSRPKGFIHIPSIAGDRK